MAYHPQMDGQTERVNQEVEQFLQLFMNQQQDKWYDWLAIAEFAYNDQVHTSTLLRVSALHYLAGAQVSEGFWTVASAHALCQPTSCGSEYFYNQCPQVRNLIGTEHSLNRSECRVKSKAS